MNDIPLPEAFLETREASGKSRLVQIGKSPYFIGRGQEHGNDLQLSDKRISRKAAQITFEDGRFRLEDRGQSRGIFVNGEKIESRHLEDGDTINFGGLTDSYTLVFRRSPATQSVNEILHRLEDTQVLQPEARSLRQLSLLLETTALLQSQLPLEEVLARVVDHAIEATGADRGVLLQNDGGKGELRLAVARRRGNRALPADKARVSNNAVQKALRAQRSIVAENIEKLDLADAKSVVEQGLRSLVAIPLLPLTQTRSVDTTYVPNPQDVLGVLYLDSQRPVVFSRLERQMLDALAADAASVLDNARLVQREVERRRLEQELSIARSIQQALLPKEFKRYPHLEVTGTNRSCLAVGGDYFDLMELGSERTGFVIADVSGKGLGAALVTAMLQGTFSALTLGQEPTQVFQHVNRFICDHSEMERYATLFFGIVSPVGEFIYLNAGHLPPLLARKQQIKSTMNARSLPVGLFPEAEFPAQTGRLEPGDTLVFYTDGITEAENAAGEQFGLDRLQATVGQHAEASVAELQANILAAVEDFTRGAYQSDDITLLVIRYCG